MCVLQTAHLWLHLSPEYFASSPLEQPWYFVHLGYLLFYLFIFDSGSFLHSFCP